jgi:hypothetical protein
VLVTTSRAADGMATASAPLAIATASAAKHSSSQPAAARRAADTAKVTSPTPHWTALIAG